jgi:hypothetical protein
MRHHTLPVDALLVYDDRRPVSVKTAEIVGGNGISLQ